MNAALYIVTCLTMLLCSVLLLRAWMRVRQRLLLWSGLCFAWLTVSSALVFVDLLVLPESDLFTWRLGTTAVGMLLLAYGLVWESR